MRPARFVSWGMTFGVVLVGWVLFRSRDLEMTAMILERMMTLASGIAWYPPLAIGALVCMILEHAAWKTRLRRAMRLPLDAWYSPIATSVMIWALLLYAPRGFRPFVYFQF